MVIFAYILSFLAVFLFAVSFHNIFYSKRIVVLERLKHSVSSEEGYSDSKKTGDRNFKESVIAFLGSVGKIFYRKDSYKDKLKRKLLHARVFLRPDEFLGVKFVAGLAFAGILFIFISNWLMLIIGFAAGFNLPDIVLNSRKSRRMNKLTQQLPEALSIVASGLRSGLGFYQAIALIVRDMDSPMKEEFEQVLFENSMGKPTEEVLNNLKERTDNEDLNIFINALIIQRQVGGSLAEILDNISHTLRERVRIKGEIKTLTAQGRLSALIICSLPVFIALAIYILNPEYISLLFTETIGRIMLFMAVVLMLIGILFVRRIIDIEV